MRLLTVILILFTLTNAKKKHRRLKNLQPDNKNGPDLETLLGPDGFENKDMQRYHPVPFGHIYKEGFDPLKLGPIDYLEMSSYYVKDTPLLKQLIPQKLALPVEKPKGFASPKDEFYFGPKVEDEDEDKKSDNDTGILDFVGLHTRNVNHNPKVGNPTLRQLVAKRRDEQFSKLSSDTERPPNSEKEHKVKYMDPNTFEINGLRRNKKEVNWTTCKEFGKKADFHPKDIVNLDWVPFYVWSGPDANMNSANVHRFTYPTKQVVSYYKQRLGPHLNKSVDWERPKLLLKETIEVLLIAADRKGLFDAIPRNEIPEELHAKGQDIIVPQTQIRLKIVDPYLAMMMCDFKYAVIMANPGNEPDTYEDKEAEAKTLNFKGTGNPVIRDLKREKWEAKLKKEYELEMENNKFIPTDY